MNFGSNYSEEYGSTLRFCAGIALHFLPVTATLLIFVLLSTAGSLILPLLHRAIIDNAIVGKDLSLLRVYLLYYLIIIIAASFLNLLREFVYTRFSNNLFHEMRLILFYKFLTAKPGSLDGISEGDLLNTIIEDAKAIRSLIIEVIIAVLSDLLTCLIAFCIMYSLNPAIAFLALCFVPLYYLLHRCCNRFIRIYAKRLREAVGRIYSITMESLRGLLTIKLNNSYHFEIDYLARQSQDFSKQRMSLLMANALMFQSTHFALLCCAALIWLIGGRSVIAGALSLGSLVALSEYFLRFVSPLNSIGNANVTFQSNLASMKKIKTLLDCQQEGMDLKLRRGEVSTGLVSSLGCTVSRTGKTGRQLLMLDSLSFHDLSLVQGGANDSLLERINLTLKRGDKIGIIGRSGVGKSTLARLAVGLIEPTSGSVLINGEPVSCWDLLSVRRRISYVPQTPFIFSRSLKENTGYCLDIPDAELVDMSRELFMDDLMKSLDWDIYREVTSQKLSGGEMQKISLMRYLLRKSDFYILDEALANMDKLASQSIVEALVKDRSNATVFITHDLTLLDKLDCVYLLDNRRLTPITDKLSLAQYADLFTRAGA